jgi:heat shock protein beta
LVKALAELLRFAVMASLTAIILHALVSQARSEGSTDMDLLLDRALGDLVQRSRAKAFEVFSFPHDGLDDATLGKSGHLAVPASQQALPGRPAALRPQSYQLPFRTVGTPGLDMQHRPLTQSSRVASAVSRLPPVLASALSRTGHEAELRRPSVASSGYKRSASPSARVVRATAATEEAEATGAETFKFEAEVGRIMDIIVNSIYSDKDVFLRELISNSADALEKKRFISVTEKKAAAEETKITVSSVKDTKTLYIEDNGVGMTKQELIDNLGRIANSGTLKFTEAMQKKDDTTLIGQFGVGFYSAYLVAEQVTVTTRSFNQTGTATYQWQSVPGDFGNFKIKEVTAIQGEHTMLQESSGTQIALKLKDDALEYLDPNKLQSLLKKYSEFIPFPINLWNEKTEYVQVPDGNMTNEDGTIKMKSEPKQVWNWEVLNTNKPLWLRDPKKINQSEYSEFYKTTFRAFDEPLASIHFSAEGQIEFRALLFFPTTLPWELSQNMFAENGRAIRLYVKRVFINDKFEDIVPRWLTFLRGVVDSDDLPLNVGREILQQSKTLTLIRKRVVRKVLDWVESTESKDPDKFNTLWENYGRYFKVGLIEDAESKEELKKIVRFWSSTTGDNTTNLANYVSRMAANQEKIYYVTGEGRKSTEMAPAMEKMKARGLEVLYLVDPLDEISVTSMGLYDGKRFVDINKGDLDLEQTDEEKQKLNMTNTEFDPLVKWMQGTALSEKVKEVKVSTRLTDSASVLVQAEWGMSPTMQRYMRAQASARGEDKMQLGQMNQAILEINPEHPIIKKLKDAYAANPESDESKDLANFAYEIAALTGGYQIEDPAAFAKRVTALIK